MLKKKIKIIKVPADENVYSAPIRQNFPKMPNLYLELIENKSKIAPELVNKEYEHTETYQSPDTKSPEDVYYESGAENDDERENERENENKTSKQNSPDNGGNSRDEQDQEGEQENESRSGSPDLSNRLKDILDDPTEKVVEKPIEKPIERRENLVAKAFAPKLSEVGKHKKVVEELGTDSEERLKKDLLFRFQILKKSYSNHKIPDFTVHSDYRTMLDSYDETVKHIHIDSSVETYKGYLTMGFYLIEYVLSTWLNFNMKGFSSEQLTQMNKYDALLIELGEKNYIPKGEQWSVEIRLLGLILLQTAMFVITREIMGKMLSGFGSTESKPQPKSKMMGPPPI
jgi:hypothetical protein